MFCRVCGAPWLLGVVAEVGEDVEERSVRDEEKMWVEKWTGTRLKINRTAR